MLPPAAYLVTAPGYRRPVDSMVDAMRVSKQHAGSTVQALVLWADAAGMLRERIDALRAEHAVAMAEAEIMIAAMAGELALLRQRAPP